MAKDDFFTPPKSVKHLKPASVNVRGRRVGSKPARVNLVPQEFENLIEDQGVLCLITPVVLCPNRTSLTDTNHVLDCPLCSGDQVIESPTDSIEEWAYIQGVKDQMKELVQGNFDLKDATITTKQSIRLSYWYKIEVLDFAAVFNQIVMRGAGDTDRLRYRPAKPGATILTPADEPLTTRAPDVPYILIDSKGVHYNIDKHFTVANQNLVWKTANRPTAGTLYSLIYPVLPTFRVLELIHEHRYYYVDFKRVDKIPVNLPQQAVIRWDYLARGSGQAVPAPAP